MNLSLYALLLRTLVIDLQAKNQHNICKGIEKKSGKLFHQWNLLSLKQVFLRMMNDSHVKNQLNICKRLEKNFRELFDRWNLLSPRSVISPKINGV